MPALREKIRLLNALAFDTSSAMNTVAIGKMSVSPLKDTVNAGDYLAESEKASSEKERMAVYSAGEAIHSISTLAPRKHMELLFPYIKECLVAAQMTISDLNAIFVGIGPGSFSGNRLGVTAARTLAGALEVPLIGIPTTENLIGRLVKDMINRQAGGAGIETQRVVALIDGKMDEIYFQQASVTFSSPILAEAISFEGAPAVSKKALLSKRIIDGNDLIIIGDGTSFYEQFILEEFPLAVKIKKIYDMPDAAVYFDLLVGRDFEPDPRSWEKVFPLYLRLSQAEENYLLNAERDPERADGRGDGRKSERDPAPGTATRKIDKVKNNES